MTTKIITVEATPPAESTGADYYKGAPLNAAEFDQNLVNLRAAVDRKASLSNPTFTGTVVLPATTSIGDVSATELQYINSVTSNVQDQLNGKQATITTLATNKGGTGLTSFTSGGVVYASSTSALTTGSALTFDGSTFTAPATVVVGNAGALSIKQATSGYAGFLSWQTSTGTRRGYFGFPSSSSSHVAWMLEEAGDMYFGTNSTERMRLDSSGNLGIGVAPSYKLDVRGTDRELLYVSSSSNTDTIFHLANSGTGGTDWQLRSSANNGIGGGGKLVFYNGTTSVNAMTLDSSGNLGLQATPKANFQIGSGSANLSADGLIGSMYGSNFYYSSGWKRIASGYGTCAIAFNDGGNAGKVRILTSGSGTSDSAITWSSGPYVNNGGTSWTTESDARLKNITGTITDAVTKVCSLTAAEYTLIADESKRPRVGLIAQEVLQVLPEAVDVPETEINGNGETLYMGISYTDVIPLLVAAIKEQQTIIESLTERIAALEYTKQGE